MGFGKIYRVAICGAKQCGKTSIIQKCIYNQSGPFSETIEDIFEANLENDKGIIEQVHIFDTAGFETEFVNKEIFHQMDGFILGNLKL